MAYSPTSSYTQPNLKGTGFTNLQSILNANAGNNLNSAIGNQITSAGQQAQNNLGSAVNTFNQGVSQGNLANTQNQQEVANTINGIENPTAANGNFDYSKFDANTNNPFYTPQVGQDFSKFISGQYSGPQQINNISQIQGQLQNAQQLGQDTKSAGGRQSLLQNFSNNPQYNQGEQTLDTAFLNGGQLQKAAQGTAGLNNLGLQAQNAAQNSVNQATTASQEFGQNTKNALGSYDTTANTGSGAIGDIGTKLNNQVQQDIANQNTAWSNLQQTAANPSGGFVGDAQQLTGIAPGTVLYHANPTPINLLNYATESPQATFQTAGTPEQNAQLLALGQLGGTIPTGLSTTGTQYSSPYTFNNSQLGTDTEAGQQAFFNAVNNTPDAAYNTGTSTASNPGAAPTQSTTPTLGQDVNTAQQEIGGLLQNLLSNNPGIGNTAINSQILQQIESGSGLTANQLQQLSSGISGSSNGPGVNNPNSNLNYITNPTAFNLSDSNTVQQLLKGANQANSYYINQGPNSLIPLASSDLLGTLNSYNQNVLPLLQQLNAQYGTGTALNLGPNSTIPTNNLGGVSSNGSAVSA